MAPSLWEFAVARYAHPGVEQACLCVQDSWGGNTPLLLFACWLEARQIPLNVQRLDAALKLVNEWDIRYVQPLRELRRGMKAEFSSRLEEVEQVRQQIKKAEMYAEQKALQWLEILSTDWLSDDDVERGQNLTSYLKSLRLPDELATEFIAVLTG